MNQILFCGAVIGALLSSGGCRLFQSSGAPGSGASSRGRTAKLQGEPWCVGDATGTTLPMPPEEQQRLLAWQNHLTDAYKVKDLGAACKATIPVCLDITSFRSDAVPWPAGVGSDISACEAAIEGVAHACRASDSARQALTSKVDRLVCQRASGTDPSDPSALELGVHLGMAFEAASKSLVARVWIKPRADDYNEISSTKEENFYDSSLWLQESF